MTQTPVPLRGSHRITLQLSVYGVPSTDSDPAADHAYLADLLCNAEECDARAIVARDRLVRNLNIQVDHIASRAPVPTESDRQPLLDLCASTAAAQTECMLARRRLRRLIGLNRNVFVTQPIPSWPVSVPERHLYVALELCALLTDASSLAPGAVAPLDKDAITSLLIDACSCSLPKIVDGVLSVLALQPLSAAAWAHCIVHIIVTVFSKSSCVTLPLRRAVLDAVKKIAKVRVF